MRHAILIAVLLSPVAARAETLAVDEPLLYGAASLLAGERQASAALPALLELAEALEAAPKGGTSKSSSSSSSSGAATSNPLSGVGVGLQVGAPTALTFKFGAQNNASIVLGIGAGIGWRGNFFGLHLHGDYLFNVATLISNADLNLSAYVGPGLFITLFNANAYGFGFGYYYYGNYAAFGFGARVPLGVNLRFSAAPIEVYLELDPMLMVFPGIDFGLGASLGFRWFF
ncbi:MAG: DUF3996 domain-containing protein [Deltaproteobacteria bacterium]|nr:DUF3996 domain-containing protein [Deltaproteobacteria bacterium]